MVERKAASDAGHDGLPTLFTLLHPLDDLCPITFRRPAASTRRERGETSTMFLTFIAIFVKLFSDSPDLTVLGFYSDPRFRVLQAFLDPDSPPFVVCYDSSAGKHLVSVLLLATPQVQVWGSRVCQEQGVSASPIHKKELACLNPSLLPFCRISLLTLTYPHLVTPEPARLQSASSVPLIPLQIMPTSPRSLPSSSASVPRPMHLDPLRCPSREGVWP